MTLRNRRHWLTVGCLTATAALITACGGNGGEGDAADAGEGSSGLTVVASTNVWGSVAAAVGGSNVEVVSIIDEAGADPHSYESQPSDAAELVGADLIVHNGAGYDEFVSQIIASEGLDTPAVEAAAVAGVEGHSHDHGHDHDEDGHEHSEDGHEHSEDGHDEEPADHDHDHDEHSHEHGAEDNEHVWYDLAVVSEVAERIADELSELDADNADGYRSNLAEFQDGIDELATSVAELGESEDGGHPHVLSTESVATYLLADAHIHDLTPAGMHLAMHNETDPPAAVIAEINEIIDGGEADVMINNPQTETGVTNEMLSRAEQAGMPVVEFTETLPEGQDDFLAWMTDQVDALAAALGR
ncbi:metal ABC transporter solute-binding protein, Zn/Mn family [Actinoalloteichus caeruleus]|uniref:metal ABC transporter solute-binding protein, Zn/Mn family n=1 Tax=Actinoalloteichus cyanogriseus TaxID=2893586 RepID=UPI0004AB416E|nr:zinc ABC transporter substrate-binding protein [Actinoalloteichus caeruleus]